MLIENEFLAPSELAKKLGRTTEAVKAKIDRERIRRMNNNVVITAYHLARILGVHGNTVYKWIDNGAIVPTRYVDYTSIGGKGARVVFTWEYVYNWVADENTWPLWSIATIADPDLRAHAQQVRTNDPWLSISEIAQLRHTVRSTINQLILKGKLPAQRIGGRWYVRREDLLNMSLALNG